jgi:hypothetical protein
MFPDYLGCISDISESVKKKIGSPITTLSSEKLKEVRAAVLFSIDL